MKDYIKGCNICLASKIVRYKLYNYLQFLLVLIYHWKDLLINYIISLPILTDWKKDSYNSIFVIINQFIKIVYYKLVKIIINALDFVEVIINNVIGHHSLPDLIIINWGLFSSQNSSYCYAIFLV